LVNIIFMTATTIDLCGAADSAREQVVIKDVEVGGLPEGTEGTGS